MWKCLDIYYVVSWGRNPSLNMEVVFVFYLLFCIMCISILSLWPERIFHIFNNLGQETGFHDTEFFFSLLLSSLEHSGIFGFQMFILH